MKHTSLLVVLSLVMFSCSRISDEISDQIIPEPETLEVAIKNNTNYRFIRPEIILNNSTYVYQITEPNSYSGFYEMPYIYSEIDVRIKTEDKLYSFSPNSYNESSLVTEGRYYFEINISTNDVLTIIRKKY